MEAESVFRKGFRQEIGMLVIRFHMRGFKLFLLDNFSQEMVADIYVRRVRVRHEVDRYLDRTLVVLKNMDAQIP